MVLELIHEFNRCKVHMQGFITALCSSKDKPNCIKKAVLFMIASKIYGITFGKTWKNQFEYIVIIILSPLVVEYEWCFHFSVFPHCSFHSTCYKLLLLDLFLSVLFFILSRNEIFKFHFHIVHHSRREIQLILVYWYWTLQNC